MIKIILVISKKEMRAIFLLLLLLIIIGIIWLKRKNNQKKNNQEAFITNHRIEDFLLGLGGKEFIYIPNGGNGGDSLIACGTYYLLDQLKLKYRVGKWEETYQGQLLVYGGGGNFNGKIFNGVSDFIRRNHPKELNNQIIVLPHTIANNDQLLKELGPNVILMCRERYSYEYVTKIVQHPDNIYLFGDMAFQLQSLANSIMEHSLDGNIYPIGNFFRTDEESKNNKLPNHNRDLSLMILYDPTMRNKELVLKNTIDILKEINKYQEINTDRLHLGIAGSLLNKKVNFYQNSYYKNKAVYEYSLKDKYPRTQLLD